MTQRLNITELEAHRLEEEKARIIGDAAAERTAFYNRRYVPEETAVVVPSRWYILAPHDFEIDVNGSLELDVDAILEVL